MASLSAALRGVRDPQLESKLARQHAKIDGSGSKILKKGFDVIVKVLAWGSKQVIEELPFGSAITGLGKEIYQIHEALKENDEISKLFTDRLTRVLETVEELSESDFEHEARHGDEAPPAFQSLVDVLVNARASLHKWSAKNRAKKILGATKYKDLFRGYLDELEACVRDLTLSLAAKDYCEGKKRHVELKEVLDRANDDFLKALQEMKVENRANHGEVMDALIELKDGIKEQVRDGFGAAGRDSRKSEAFQGEMLTKMEALGAQIEGAEGRQETASARRECELREALEAIHDLKKEIFNLRRQPTPSEFKEMFKQTLQEAKVATPAELEDPQVKQAQRAEVAIKNGAATSAAAPATAGAAEAQEGSVLDPAFLALLKKHDMLACVAKLEAEDIHTFEDLCLFDDQELKDVIGLGLLHRKKIRMLREEALERKTEQHAEQEKAIAEQVSAKEQEAASVEASNMRRLKRSHSLDERAPDVLAWVEALRLPSSDLELQLFGTLAGDFGATELDEVAELGANEVDVAMNLLPSAKQRTFQKALDELRKGRPQAGGTMKEDAAVAEAEAKAGEEARLKAEAAGAFAKAKADAETRAKAQDAKARAKAQEAKEKQEKEAERQREADAEAARQRETDATAAAAAAAAAAAEPQLSPAEQADANEKVYEFADEGDVKKLIQALKDGGTPDGHKVRK